jgi:hypothetical protein
MFSYFVIVFSFSSLALLCVAKKNDVDLVKHPLRGIIGH